MHAQTRDIYGRVCARIVSKYIPVKKKKFVSKTERKKFVRENNAKKSKKKRNTPKNQYSPEKKESISSILKVLNKVIKKIKETVISEDNNLTGRGFYKDKEAGHHPAYQLSATEKTWTRLSALTHKKKKNARYIDLDDNPNPNDTEGAYLRKYIRTSSIGTRGDHLPSYVLSERDSKKIEEYVKNHKEKSVKK